MTCAIYWINKFNSFTCPVDVNVIQQWTVGNQATVLIILINSLIEFVCVRQVLSKYLWSFITDYDLLLKDIQYIRETLYTGYIIPVLVIMHAISQIFWYCVSCLLVLMSKYCQQISLSIWSKDWPLAIWFLMQSSSKIAKVVYCLLCDRLYGNLSGLIVIKVA